MGGDPLQKSLCKKKPELQTFSDAGRDAVEAREDFQRLSGRRGVTLCQKNAELHTFLKQRSPSLSDPHEHVPNKNEPSMENGQLRLARSSLPCLLPLLRILETVLDSHSRVQCSPSALINAKE